MSRLLGWCELCARFTDSSYDKERDETTLYCEAYPKGVPEAVYESGHLYPKPGDNGLQFKLREGAKLPEYLNQSQEEEDANYREYAEYYEEINMSDIEFAEKMKREHGEYWHLYRKPVRISD